MSNSTVRANAQATPTDRRTFLGTAFAAAAASGTIPASAAALPESPATDAQWAAIEFEPIDADTLSEFRPATNKVWEDTSINSLLIPARLAWLSLSKTKEELKDCLRQLGFDDGDAGTEMVTSIDTAYNFFYGMAQMLNCARTRCFSAAAAIELEEQAAQATPE
jgi:hypothetical protein